MPSGCGPTGIVAVTVFVAGSTRVTVFKYGLESQTAAVAGGGRFRGADLDPRHDDVPRRVDPHERRLGVAHRPDSAFTDGQRPSAPLGEAALARPTRIRATTFPPGGSTGAAVEPVGPSAFFASKTEPTIAATTDATITASRNRRRAEERAGTDGTVIRSS